MSNLIARYKRPVRRYLFRFSRVEDQFSSLRKVLEENNWFFSSRRYFDDQDDMVMPEVRIRGVPEETLLRARENLQRLWNDMGVLCFSEVWNDPRMWSLYADSGNGVCLRLSCASLKAGLAPPDCPLPVLYSDRARAPWRVPEDEREDEEVVAESLLQKSLDWEYQREWRMLRHTGGYNALPLNALCGLIFGWHVTTEVRREIAGWIDSGSRHMSQEEAIPSGDRLTLRAAHL